MAPAVEVAASGLPVATPLITNLLLPYPRLAPLPARAPFRKAVKIKVTEYVDEPWMLNFSEGLPQPVKKGDLIAVDFWAQGMSKDARVQVGLNHMKQPYVVSKREIFSLGNTWEHIILAGNSVADYAENELHVVIVLGYGKQALCLSEINVATYGQAALSADELVARLRAKDRK